MLIKSYTTWEASAYIAGVVDGNFLCGIAPSAANLPIGISQVMGIKKIRVVLATALQTRLGLVVALAAGTPVNPIRGQICSQGNGGYNGGNNSQGQLLTGWSANPAISGAPVYLEQSVLPAVIGSTFEWTWPDDDPLGAYPTSPTFTTPGLAGQGYLLRNLNGGGLATGDCIVTVRWSVFSP